MLQWYVSAFSDFGFFFSWLKKCSVGYSDQPNPNFFLPEKKYSFLFLILLLNTVFCFNRSPLLGNCFEDLSN